MTAEKPDPKPAVLLLAPIHPPTQARLQADYSLAAAFPPAQRDATLLRLASTVTAAVTSGGAGIDRATIDRLPRLELIACFGVGVDAIDLVAARERGIAVTNTPDVLTGDVADLALGLLLALIGQAIAIRASAFGLQIAYHGPRAKPLPYRFEPDLVALARGVDFLVAACPGGAATRGLVSRAVIEALGAEGLLINIARGSVVDQDALVTALVDGRLGGAGLDVFADEPNVPPALLGLDNVVLQPHQASATAETRAAMGKLVIDNLAAFFAGRPLLTAVG